MRDLKVLVVSGLLQAPGERRGRSYSATLGLRAIYERSKIEVDFKDPFDETDAPVLAD
jgi:hypothetical protein